MTVKKKSASFVDIAKLTIADDPLPTHRNVPGHKYDAVFDKLKPGKCLVCEPGDAGKIGHALNTYLKRKGKPGKVRTAQAYEKDGKGACGSWQMTRPARLDALSRLRQRQNDRAGNADAGRQAPAPHAGLLLRAQVPHL